MITVGFDSPKGFLGLLDFLSRKLPIVFRRLESIGAELLDEVAEDLRQIILKKDRTRFIKRLRALSPRWKQEKKREGWFPQQLAATGFYGRAIVTEHDYAAHEHRLGVKSATYPGHKFTYGDLANYLEHGTKWFKPIPHWRRAAEYFSRELAKRTGRDLKSVSIRIG